MPDGTTYDLMGMTDQQIKDLVWSMPAPEGMDPATLERERQAAYSQMVERTGVARDLNYDAFDVISGKEATDTAAREAGAATDANKQLQNELMAEQARQFDIMREDYAPYRELGTAQLPMLQQMAQSGEPSPTMEGFYASPESQIGNIQDFQASPGYQFMLDQGLNAIQNSAAAGGSLESGRTLKALQGYGQNLANQEYNNWYGRRAGEFGSYANRLGSQYGNQFNRLAALAGVGQTATGATSQLGQNQLAMQQQGTQNLMGMNNQMAQVNAAAAMQPYNFATNLIGQGAMLYGMRG